jgi:acyl-CoA synthetase (AMP-forming)/AMP-acid ligase II
VISERQKVFHHEYYYDDLLNLSARKYPGKTAVIFEGIRLTYGEVNDRANAIANSLMQMGIQKGDRVTLIADNTFEWIEMYFAPAKLGATFCPVNSTAPPKEMESVLRYLSPKVVILQPRFVPMIQSIKERLTGVSLFIVIGEDAPGMENYDKLIDKGPKHDPDIQLDPLDTALILFTGGTTGMPRGAMHTHKGCIYNAYAASIATGQTHDDVEMHITPMYHTAMAAQLMASTLLSNTHVITRKFDAERVLELIAKEGITCGFVVPTIINKVLHVPDLEKYDLSSLRCLYYGGAPMPMKLLEQALEVLQCNFMQFYGQTEGLLYATLSPQDHVVKGPPDKVKRSRAAGRAIVNYELRVVDDQGEDVPSGEVGEIVVKGPTMSNGFWDKPDETANLIRNGWLHTGDLAYMDEDGYVYVVERKKDVIISGGKNIYCPEVESVLYSHPAILEATVFGIPDDYWGEAVKAAVVLKPGNEVSEEELIEFVSRNISSYKKPKSIDFLEELPKNNNGKIVKRVLRDQYWKHAERSI